MTSTLPATDEEQSASLDSAGYQSIKRAIIRCELAPGARVSESELVEGLGLGRAAVRSALSRLLQEGLVRPIARRGHIVTPISVQDVRDVFDVRRQLEPLAVFRAAESDVDLSHLRSLEEACRRAHYRPGDRLGVERFLAANTTLHVGIAKCGGNRRLTKVIQELLEASERLFHLALRIADRNDEMYHEHHALIDALVSHDSNLARDVAVDQIQASEDMVIAALLSSSGLRNTNLAELGLDRHEPSAEGLRRADRTLRRSARAGSGRPLAPIEDPP